MEVVPSFFKPPVKPLTEVPLWRTDANAFLVNLRVTLDLNFPSDLISHFLPLPENTTLILVTDMGPVPEATKPWVPIGRWKWHPSCSQILVLYMSCSWDLSVSPDRVSSEMKICSVNISYISFKQWKCRTVQASVVCMKWITKFLMQLTGHSSKVQVPGNLSSWRCGPDTGYDPKPLHTEAIVTKSQHWSLALGS